MTHHIVRLIALACLTTSMFLWPLSEQAHAVASEADTATIGEAAPAFTLPDAVTGERVRLADHEGKIVVLLFHSITCPYYKMNENAGYDRVFVEMVEAYEEKDVVFLGINANSKETAVKIAKYCNKYEVNYPVLKDEGNNVADAYGGEVTPHVMVIDQQGKLRYRGGVERHAGGPAGCGESETPYLGPVIDALLKGEDPPFTETEPKGCKIKRG